MLAVVERRSAAQSKGLEEDRDRVRDGWVAVRKAGLESKVGADWGSWKEFVDVAAAAPDDGDGDAAAVVVVAAAAVAASVAFADVRHAVGAADHACRTRGTLRT